MCLIAFAWDVHPRHRLLLAANRDEFHRRPAAGLAWWRDAPILGGRDLQEGGAWLAASRSGRFAAVTNVRGPDASAKKPRSRGGLVAGFLTSTVSGEAFGRAIESTAAEYGGFNLLLIDGATLTYVSNRPFFTLRAVAPGVHGLSNAQLDTPWPKVVAARTALEAWMADGLDAEQPILAAMASRAVAPDDGLPDTGVGLAAERSLSPAFIRLDTYGTRCTTLVRLGRDGTVAMFERRYDAGGAPSGDSRESFEVDAGA